MNRTKRHASSPGALVPDAQGPRPAKPGSASGAQAQSAAASLTQDSASGSVAAVVNPSHLKRKGLDRSKDRIIARYPRERSDLIKAHGYSISSIVTEALDRVYTELLSAGKPRPKR